MSTLQLESWPCYVAHDMRRSEEAALLARRSESGRSDLPAARLALDALEHAPRIPAPADLALNVMANENSCHHIVSVFDETEESVKSRMRRARQMFEQLYGRLS